MPAAIEALPAIAEALGDRLEILLDGGVRRGTHVLKALALGAKAVTIGRPYIYGVTAGGQQGVAKVLSIFRAELTRDCQLLGAPSLAAVGPRLGYSPIIPGPRKTNPESVPAVAIASPTTVGRAQFARPGAAVRATLVNRCRRVAHGS